MRKFLRSNFCILLSMFILVFSVPAIPVNAQAVAVPLDYDVALQIYEMILTLIETGRLTAGYKDSIFQPTASYQDFLDHKQEIDDYINAHPEKFTGVTFYTNAGNVVSLDDWKQKPWKRKNGNIIEGGIGYKISEFDASDIENFNNGMNNGSFNENNNNPFDIIKKVFMGAGALASASGLFEGIKNCIGLLGFEQGGIPYTTRQEWLDATYDSGVSSVAIIAGNSESLYNGTWTLWENPQPGMGATAFVAETRDFYRPTEPYSRNFVDQAISIYPSLGMRDAILYGNGYLNANFPVFRTFQDWVNWNPANLVTPDEFNHDSLADRIDNLLALPLLDTLLRPFGYIGIANGLSTGLNNLATGADATQNTNNWVDDLEDILGRIIPIYIPDQLPDPEPNPEPDPQPEPEPDPLPDPDVDDEDPDPWNDWDEIPLISGLQNRFPFSIPWDLKALFQNLSAEPSAPHWEYNFYISPQWLPPAGFSYVFSIDLRGFEWLASLFRRLFLSAFVIGLAIYSYGKFFGGGD